MDGLANTLDTASLFRGDRRNKRPSQLMTAALSNMVSHQSENNSRTADLLSYLPSVSITISKEGRNRVEAQPTAPPISTTGNASKAIRHVRDLVPEGDKNRNMVFRIHSGQFVGQFRANQEAGVVDTTFWEFTDVHRCRYRTNSIGETDAFNKLMYALDFRFTHDQVSQISGNLMGMLISNIPGRYNWVSPEETAVRREVMRQTAQYLVDSHFREDMEKEAEAFMAFIEDRIVRNEEVEMGYTRRWCSKQRTHVKTSMFAHVIRSGHGAFIHARQREVQAARDHVKENFDVFIQATRFNNLRTAQTSIFAILHGNSTLRLSEEEQRHVI